MTKPRKIKTKIEKLSLQYIAGTVNEYRIWTHDGMYPKDKSEDAGYERARKITRWLRGKAA